MLKPAIVVGGVTVNKPQPGLTTGAVGAAGKITILTVLLTPHVAVPAVPAAVPPQIAEVTYLACTVWQPGVVVVGDAEKAPPSILYSILNPLTAVTVGKVNADAHVPAGAVIAGAVGKITTLTVLLTPQVEVPAVPAAVAPHVAAVTYLA